MKQVPGTVTMQERHCKIKSHETPFCHNITFLQFPIHFLFAQSMAVLCEKFQIDLITDIDVIVLWVKFGMISFMGKFLCYKHLRFSWSNKNIKL